MNNCKNLWILATNRFSIVYCISNNQMLWLYSHQSTIVNNSKVSNKASHGPEVLVLDLRGVHEGLGLAGSRGLCGCWQQPPAPVADDGGRSRRPLPARMGMPAAGVRGLHGCRQQPSAPGADDSGGSRNPLPAPYGNATRGCWLRAQGAPW